MPRLYHKTENYKTYERTPEIRKKIRRSLLGNIPWNKGKKRPPFSAQWIEKLRISHLGNKSHTGEKHSEAYKKRMRKATRGIKKPFGFGAKVSSSLKGKEKSESHRKALSLAHTNPDRAGVLARCGAHGTMEYAKWSRAVKYRDGHKCKIADEFCAGRLESHHIFSSAKHPEIRYVVSNGITLCKFHHPKSRREEKRLAPFFRQRINNHGTQRKPRRKNSADPAAHQPQIGEERAFDARRRG